MYSFSALHVVIIVRSFKDLSYFFAFNSCFLHQSFFLKLQLSFKKYVWYQNLRAWPKCTLMAQTLRRPLKHLRSKIWREGKYRFWQYCMSLLAFLLIFFCSAVGSLCLLWYIQYIICKVHEALWDLSELQLFCKWNYTLLSIVTSKHYILFRKLFGFAEIRSESWNVMYHS